jgi:hypothetical protein
LLIFLKYFKRTIPVITEQPTQAESYHSLRHEIEQWQIRYNYILTENLSLTNRNKELEAEVNV